MPELPFHGSNIGRIEPNDNLVDRIVVTTQLSISPIPFSRFDAHLVNIWSSSFADSIIVMANNGYVWRCGKPERRTQNAWLP